MKNVVMQHMIGIFLHTTNYIEYELGIREAELSKTAKNKTVPYSEGAEIATLIKSIDTMKKTWMPRYTFPYIVYYEDKIYYTELMAELYEADEDASWDIWCYDIKTGENEIFLSEKEWRRTAGAEKDFINFWVSDDMLYLYLQKEDRDSILEYVLTMPLSKGGKLKWEKKLNSQLRTRGIFLLNDIIYGYAFYDCDSDEEEYYCYNFRTGENKKVTKDAPEYWYWYEFE